MYRGDIELVQTLWRHIVLHISKVFHLYIDIFSIQLNTFQAEIEKIRLRNILKIYILILIQILIFFLHTNYRRIMAYLC